MDHGVALDLNSRIAPLVRHRIGWEGVWRFMQSHTSSAPYDIRELSGNILKSLFLNEILKDTRDHSMLAEEGYLLRLQHELAGVGGDVKHSKQELHAQINFPLFPGVSLQGTFGAGFISALGGAQINFADRFFLGGLHLRGFVNNHIGPHSKGFATGGTAFWSSGLHLYAPLPFSDPYQPLLRHIRLHGFFNMGGVGSSTFWKELLVHFPCTVGGGLVLALGKLARLEINITHVLRASSDHVRSGVLSFGFGVSHS